MKNGYYLSIYACIDKLSYLKELTVRHDMNLSLWKKEGKNIKLIHYWELERLTGNKQHDIAFFDLNQACNLINNLLKQYDLSLNDMVEIWGTPGIETCEGYHSNDEYPNLCYHSISHLFSSLLFNTELFHNEDIIALAVDGGPDSLVDKKITQKKFYSGAFSTKGNIIDVFPINSPGGLWDGASEFYNLKEGTLMALASASKSELNRDFELEGSIHDIKSYQTVRKNLENILRNIEFISDSDEGVLFNYFDKRFSKKENKASMAVKAIQKMSIEIMEKNLEKIINKYNIDPSNTYLAISGGYGLNCPTNSHLMHKYKFKGLIAPPYINDSGLSLGIALYSFYKKLGKEKFEFKFENAYYGDEDLSFYETIERYKNFVSNISNIDSDTVVDDIVNSPIIWFDGRAEVGPRALGHRSILADARCKDAKDKLNKIKQRQWWRPVAPIILEEEVSNWFQHAYESPYMLNTFKLIEGRECEVPAIAHLDNSARIQTINSRDNPKLYKIISHFNKKYNIPIVCNTSLNDSGEPIINSIEEMINFALRKKFKVAYVNGYRVEFKNHESYLENKPLKRKFDFNSYVSTKEKNEWLEKLNPYGLEKNILEFYVKANNMEININNKADIRMLKVAYKVYN
ncbi:hypothetical protein AMS60_02440 [Bacillus sp. FJAT-21945]|nr:hypothetical protein AMS60_02440 [Bacillus sp. FJAT-21945]